MEHKTLCETNCAVSCSHHTDTVLRSRHRCIFQTTPKIVFSHILHGLGRLFLYWRLQSIPQFIHYTLSSRSQSKGIWAKHLSLKSLSFQQCLDERNLKAEISLRLKQ